MDAEVKTGGPAFPDGSINQWGIPQNSGMTLRDYFAAKWIQGAAADPTTRGWKGSAIEYARIAYSVADDMLKAREQ